MKSSLVIISDGNQGINIAEKKVNNYNKDEL